MSLKWSTLPPVIPAAPKIPQDVLDAFDAQNEQRRADIQQRLDSGLITLAQAGTERSNSDYGVTAAIQRWHELNPEDPARLRFCVVLFPELAKVTETPAFGVTTGNARNCIDVATAKEVATFREGSYKWMYLDEFMANPLDDPNAGPVTFTVDPKLEQALIRLEQALVFVQQETQAALGYIGGIVP